MAKRSISPTLHPLSIQGNFVGAEAARSKLEAGVRDLEQLYGAEEAHSQDPTLTPAARSAALTKLAGAVQKRGAPRYDAARAGLLAQWQHLNGKINSSLSPPLSPQLALLTVQRFASLPPEEQNAAAADLISSKRGDLLGTILHLPPFVSGLSEPRHKHLRLKWIAEHFAEEQKEMAAIQLAVEAVERAGSVFLRAVAEVEQEGQKALEAQARSEAAAQAVRGTV